jgi:chloramphenicol-sensitive protein RarD
MKNIGIWYALGAYLTWGLFPIYWKWLVEVPATQLIGHRILWSFVMLAAVLLITRQWKRLLELVQDRKIWAIYSIASVLIGINWLVYVWAVNAGYIVETSLGYFINPLISVLLGVIVFRERLRALQWIPIGLAALGVAYLTVIYGRPPWIALTLAMSFGFYGMVKKLAPLNSLNGLTLETGILLLPAVGYLLFVESSGSGAFLHNGALADLLMVGAGVVTTIPLLLFASATRRIPLSTIGIMQYIAPTLQFSIGVLVFKEDFSAAQAVGFGIVWLALVLFWSEGFWASKKSHPAVVVETP